MQIPITIMTLFFIQMIITFESSGVYAMTPILSSNFGIHSSSIILLNIGFALSGIFAPFFGVASEKYGKKKFIIIGLSTFLVGSLITSYAQDAVVFIIGRGIVGLGYYNLSGLLLAYIGDIVHYDNRGKIYGIIRGASGIGVLLSPLTATYLLTYYSLKIYYLLIVIVALLILLLTIFLPNVEIKSSYNIKLQDILIILKNNDAQTFLFMNFSMGSFLVLYFNYIGVHLVEFYALTSLEIGQTLTYSAIGTLGGIFIAGALSDRIGKLKCTKIFYVFLICSIVLINVTDIQYIWVLTFLISLGFDGAWTLIQTISSEIIPEERGVYMALVFFIVSLSLILFYLIGPIIYNIGGFLYTTACSAVLIVISFVLFLRFTMRNSDKLN